jgi:hypothetical protein
MPDTKLLFECQKALEAVKTMRETPIVDADFPRVRDRADRLVEATLKKLKQYADEMTP